MRKILVLRGGALGDLVVTLPALASLRERWPKARIELSGNATAAQLARTRGLLDAVHSQHESRWSALYGGEELSPEFARWLATFDLVLSYWPDPDATLRRHFPLRADQVFLSGAALPTAAPAAAHYCALLQHLGLTTRMVSYSLVSTGGGASRDGSLTIHPGSGSPRKNWPAENWRKLIAGLRIPVTLVLGEAELEWWDPLSSASPTRDPANPEPQRGDNLVHLINPPLEDLVSHLARCRLFVGHDSGVSHLAAACGAKCILLFGPTDPAIWAPPVPGIRVLRAGEDLAALSVECVRHAIAEALQDRA